MDVIQEKEVGFFLTGLNMNIPPEREMSPIPKYQSELDKIEIVTVVDTFKVLSQDQCFIVQDKVDLPLGQSKNTITQLSSSCKVQFQSDKLVSRYQHVQEIANLVVDEAITRPKSNRILVNVVDSLFTNNIGGFNISNFKMRYLSEYIADVIADYEQSIMGSCIKELI